MARRFYNEEELVFVEMPNNCGFLDLEGQKFGRLTVIGYAGKPGSERDWFCKCNCGKIIKTKASRLKNGTTTSCGCFNIESIVKRSTKHGHSRVGNVTSTYKTWAKMIERCRNPNSIGFFDYGGRGITVCDRWLKFENFLKDMGNKPNGTSIDRKDNDLGYYKDNCRWATIKEQANNKRNNRLLTLDGRTQTVTQWSEELGLRDGCIRDRINKYGWSVERALTTPLIVKFSHPVNKR